VLESTRAKENAVKEETAEQLDAFRKQRALAEQSLLGLDDDNGGKPDNPTGADTWSLKKRKRRRDEDRSTQSLSVGAKLRRTSSSATDGRHPMVSESSSTARSEEVPGKSMENSTGPSTVNESPPQIEQQKPSPITVGLGLGGYSSDEDD